ncbi:MAG: 2-hydroxyacid dehydrogenase [Chloroflexi bacterium]|nr:2-hydroxyacid dehydrogenase [Chloroflexota bacterium]
MTSRVFYMSSPPAAQREIMLSVQPPDFEASFLETDDADELRSKLLLADFIVAHQITADQIAIAERARLIQGPGVGYEKIDVDAAQRRGIPVAITPEGTVQGVSEHTILLILALYKHLTDAHTALKNGHWIHQQLRPICLMLEDKRVGIVGMGRIGREVARRLQGWGVELVYADLRRLTAAEEEQYRATYLPLEELLASSDVVTLHVFLSEASRHLIGERELGLMKPEAVLINTSRGDVVDEAALYRALAERRLYGAGIDAWSTEPTPPDNPLLRLDNVVVTPHMATANRDAMIKKSLATYANFQRVLRGEAPLNVVRPYHQVVADAAGSGG